MMAILVAALSIWWLNESGTSGVANNFGLTSHSSRAEARPTVAQENTRKAPSRNNQETASEHQQLLATFRKAASDNDGEAFRLASAALLGREYEGNPRILLEEIVPYLDHENKEIRFELAKLCIWMGLKSDKAINVLAAFLIDENEKPEANEFIGQSGEVYTKDLRKSAAKLLTIYRISQAVDPLWSAYLQTADRRYLHYLSELGDDRAGKEALELVKSGNAKYLDFHEIFGAFGVKDASAPLEAVFKARTERYPNENQSGLAWSLFQITQDKQYYKYLVDRDFHLTNSSFDIPGVLHVLDETLRADDGSDLNAEGTRAFLSLLARDNGRKILENYLVDVFEEKIKSPLDATLRYRVAAYLDSERVDTAVQQYEKKYGNGLWLHYSKRKGWPINDLIATHSY